MKGLRFAKEISVRFQLCIENPELVISRQCFEDELATIERNGSELITAVVLLEERMIEAVSLLLFGRQSERDLERNFFSNEIMGTSEFPFASKRRVFTALLERTGAVSTDQAKELRSALSKVMKWRNAFAHGRVLYQHDGQFCLAHYSGGPQELILDDTFFELVESTVRHCLYMCNDVIRQASLRASVATGALTHG
ncbi:hypothetical protein [Stenotrophomonas maltophilia]|uniref:hypothetical protein n=1 Tax=Stenotrophomonas maltophilia TaxID=40324 RepID=UPI002B16B685|nr:hypothetical protein [Stenotrophomonas maltophilia]HEP1209343.1 hypothetical protein [Stenotrophomonas maltophilia]